MSGLGERPCTACRKDMPPLDRAAIETLRAHVPDWTLCDDASRIERSYRFKDFAGALACVVRTAEIAEAAGHHPDIAFGWGYVRLSLSTHTIGGLHDNDFILAARLDAALT